MEERERERERERKKERERERKRERKRKMVTTCAGRMNGSTRAFGRSAGAERACP